MLDRLVTVADLAERAGLAIVPTLFTGHMSGVNWIPGWALGGSDRDDRFRVVSGGRVSERRSSQLVLRRGDRPRPRRCWRAEAAAALAGHEALWAWDLGNENSNCVCRRPGRQPAGGWSESSRPSAQPTRRRSSPSACTWKTWRKIANSGRARRPSACGPLSMHGYPIYATWADGPTDEHLLPFLAHITSWLGEGP